MGLWRGRHDIQTVYLFTLIIFMLKAYTQAQHYKCMSPDSNHTQAKSLIRLLLSALIIRNCGWSATICM